MDLFNRGKSKGKKRPIIDPPLIQTTTTTNTIQTSHTTPQSPKSPPNQDDYFATGTVSN
jgi:hypothetical protein